MSIRSDALHRSLAEAINTLKTRCLPPTRTAGDLHANAAFWAATRARLGTRTALAPAAAHLDQSRLKEAPYLAALGYLVAAGTEQLHLPPAAVKEGLARVLRRTPRTAEKSGYADDPICLIGLFLLARALEHERASSLQEMLRELASELHHEPSTLVLLGLADPTAVANVRPFAVATATDRALAVLALRADEKLSARLFPRLTRVEADEGLVATACSEPLQRGDDLDGMMFLVGLECVVADRFPAATSRNGGDVAKRAPPSGQVDLGVVVALKEEFRELHRWFDGAFDLVEDDGQSFYLFQVPGPDGHYRCVATFIGEMGLTTAAIVSTKLMRRWQPRTIAMVGIAAGLHDDVRVGDVVVATQVDSYIEGSKAVEDGEKFSLKTAGEVYRVDRTLLSRVQHLEFGQAGAFRTWRTQCAQRLQREGIDLDDLVRNDLAHTQPVIHDGHIASGPVVGASRSFADWLKQRDRAYRALEMESGGVLMAAYHQEHGPRTLVIRGISDLGDARKRNLDAMSAGGLRRWAMNNAVALVWTLMESGLLTRVRSARLPFVD